MKKTNYLLVCFLFSICCFICTSCDDNEVVDQPVTIKIDPVSLPVFAAEGGEKVVTVTIEPSDVKWSHENKDSWIKLTDTGDKLTISVEKNDDKARSGVVTLTAPNAQNVTIAVNQAAAGEKVFDINRKTLSFTHEGGEETVEVTSSTEWEAETDDSWLEIDQEEDKFTVTADPYPGVDKPRYGEVVVSAKETDVVYKIKVTQTEIGFVAELSIEDDDKNLTFEAEGGERTVTVTANVEWWASDKNRYEWVTIEQSEGEFTVTVDPYEEFDGVRETEILVEAEGIDDPIVVKVVQNEGTPTLSVDILKIETEYNSSVVKFNIESNTNWEIDWGAGNFNCPDGYPNGAWWGDFSPNKGKGSMEVSFNFNSMRPLTSTQSRTGEIIVSAEGVENVVIPFLQTGAPVVDIPLINMDQLFGEWEVTGEVIMIGDKIYPNNHTITITQSDYHYDAFRVSNITNINSYKDIGGASVKGDELDFLVDFDNSRFTLCSQGGGRTDYMFMDPHWDLPIGRNTTRTLVVAGVREVMNDTFFSMQDFPYVDIRLKSDGKHEIDFTFTDYSIEYEGQRYYGSIQVGGRTSSSALNFATLFGTKWTKKVE